MKAATRSAVRLARTAPASTIEQVAHSTGDSPRRVEAALRNTVTRGRCDADLVYAYNLLDSNARAELFNRHRCPPSLRRAATMDLYKVVRPAVPGVAGWASRALEKGQPPTRTVFARNAAAADQLTPRVQTATAESCPPAVLARLTEDPNNVVRRATAANTSTPAASLAALTRHADTRLRYLISTNPSTPTSSLGLQAGSPDDEDARVRIAEDLFCPANALLELASDTSADVRAAVAGNKECPLDMLETLAEDSDSDVRCAVAGNSATTEDIIDTLLQDDDLGVANVAQEAYERFNTDYY